jgi:hypothetical protein
MIKWLVSALNLPQDIVYRIFTFLLVNATSFDDRNVLHKSSACYKTLLSPRNITPVLLYLFVLTALEGVEKEAQKKGTKYVFFPKGIISEKLYHTQFYSRFTDQEN